MKKIMCFIIVVAVIFGTTTWGFASTKDENTINSIDELKMELAKYSGPDEISSMVQADLAEKVDTKTKEAFVNEKMELFFEKLKDIEMSNSEEGHIDLGDNCEVIITVSDVSEDCEIRPLANTPGATTLWKDYGNRMFTTKFEVRAVAFNVDLILENHYTLSEKGIDLRYGKANIVNQSVTGIGSASHSGVVDEKSKAHSIGEQIHVSCVFSYRFAPLYNVTLISKSIELHSKVKYSDIDKTEKQVKVVQSWNGVWL